MKIKREIEVKMALTTAQKHELLLQFNQQRGRETGEYNDMKAT